MTGLQFRGIWERSQAAHESLLFHGAVIAAAVIAIRVGWTWLSASLAGVRSVRRTWFVASCGMRGSISLAAALSIPAVVGSRNVIVALTAFVIAVTLIAQGSPLPWIIRRLRLDQDAAAERDVDSKAEAEARAEAARAAIRVLARESHVIAMRVMQENEATMRTEYASRDAEAETGWRLKAVPAARRKVIDLHREGKIDEEVLHRIERDLDLREAALASRAERS